MELIIIKKEMHAVHLRVLTASGVAEPFQLMSSASMWKGHAGLVSWVHKIDLPGENRKKGSKQCRDIEEQRPGALMRMQTL